MANICKDLSNAFKVENLHLAWKWINSNTDRHYKYFYNALYKAYGLSLQDNLKELSKKLDTGVYKPNTPVKIYLPKKSGILRPYTLLSIEDQIVYQALINIVAEKLQKKVDKNYHKVTFGHIYAGKRSNYFYRNWTSGYQEFNKALQNAFQDGYKYAASFDLTACYDSIDHKVLSHFLEEIGLEKEFIIYLRETCLSKWTTTDTNPIYQGHGIPQGPLSSGLLSEVILKHFDDSGHYKGYDIKHFRYVDDIRLFAKTESNVRKALIHLDYLSKNIGLFPQSNKINIHKISNIEEEIKSISLPPEPLKLKSIINQNEVIERIMELTKNNKIENETRFKYVLAHATPNARLSDKLFHLLDIYPHLYEPILRHFHKHKTLTKVVSRRILDFLQQEELYEEITANFLRTALGKVHLSLKNDFLDYCSQRWNKIKSIKSPHLKSLILIWLLNEGKIKYSDLKQTFNESDWWVIQSSIESIDINLFGKPSYEALLNDLLSAKTFEISLKAAYYIVEHNLDVKKPLKDIKPNAQITLKKLNKIGKTTAHPSIIPEYLTNITNYSFPSFNWRKLISNKKAHSETERLIMLCSTYYKTDPNAYVNTLDVAHEHLCNAIFQFDRSLGTYQYGNIGGCLNATSKFYMKYPKFVKLCTKVHQLRLASDLSHPKQKATGKPTRRIHFKEIKQLNNLIIQGHIELIKTLKI